MAQREHLLDQLARLAEVDLIDLDGSWPTTTTITTTTAPTARGNSDSHDKKTADSTLGKVTIDSETLSTSKESSDVEEIPAVVARPALASALVPSDVPATLNITFSPALQPPKYGLIISKLGLGPGAGFVDVTFVNCTFHRNDPTIFENCWLSNVTFTDCEFRASQFQDVVISDAKFNFCTFQCLWLNQKLPSKLEVNGTQFKGEFLHDVLPKGIVAQNKERERDRDAKLLDPVAPTKVHYSGMGAIKGSSTKEDEYLRYKVVKKPEYSREASSIPSNVTGLTFDHTPTAGLFIKTGKGWRYEARFVRCSFTNTTFDNCYLVDVVFQDCNFENASFKEVVIKGRTYDSVGFEDCSWKWRVCPNPVTIANRVYRQRGQDGPHLPQNIADQAWTQEKEEKRQEKLRTAIIKAQRPPPGIQGPEQAVSSASGVRALKSLRKDPAIKTADEIARDRMLPGEKNAIATTPGAVVKNPNEELLSTTFVQMDLSNW